jgi:hypothetical protein
MLTHEEPTSREAVGEPDLTDPIATVGCNQCGWTREEDDLAFANDAEDGELSHACPACLTDHFLMNIEVDA